jgi:hypothetical protein
MADKYTTTSIYLDPSYPSQIDTGGAGSFAANTVLAKIGCLGFRLYRKK